MKEQLSLDFKTFVNEPTFTGDFGGQCKRLYELLKIRPVDCRDAERLGIAGSALPRRRKDLKDKYGIDTEIVKIIYTRVFDGKQVKISQYKLVG